MESQRCTGNRGPRRNKAAPGAGKAGAGTPRQRSGQPSAADLLAGARRLRQLAAAIDRPLSSAALHKLAADLEAQASLRENCGMRR